MYKKAQIIGTDLMISVIIFVVLISFVFLTLTRFQLSLNNNVNSQDISLKALQISDLLVKSKGEPPNWEDNSTDASSLGLVDSDRILDINKLNAFLNLSYNTSKEKFNIESLDFYFALKDLDGSVFKINNESMEKGEMASTNATNVVTIKRAVLYGEEEKIVEFELWK